jgi:tetratricopeptide (TPR) repeat protein
MLSIGALLLLAFGLGGADGTVARAAADAAFAHMDYATAIPAYETALRAEPGDPELLWRAARAYVCAGEVAEGSERAGWMKKAEVAARSCIRLDSSRSEGHAWLAGALGYVALDASPAQQIKLVREVLRETEIAIGLRPNDDVAYSIRGSTFRALGNTGWLSRQLAKVFYGGLPGGGFSEAEESLQKAVALAPDVMRHSYELGILYTDMGRTDDARRLFERARTMPVRVGIDVPRLKKIGELLKGME